MFNISRKTGIVVAIIIIIMILLCITASLKLMKIKSSDNEARIITESPNDFPSRKMVDSFAITPSAVRDISRQSAMSINAAVPYSKAPNPIARPYYFQGLTEDFDRAESCLAAAQIYEAGSDPGGQRAVAQVVLNRVRHPAFPKSICGVVFQGSERKTGCQFTFTCDGAMAISPPLWAWKRAIKIAEEMLHGAVFGPIGYATHYHTNWVVPYWSSSLDKVAAVQSHLFFRWRGAWGQAEAFGWNGHQSEPAISQLGRFSHGHFVPSLALDFAAIEGAGNFTDAQARPEALSKRPIAPDEAQYSAQGVKIIAHVDQTNSFILQFPMDMDPAKYPDMSLEICKNTDKCDVIAWRAGESAPNAFPLPRGSISSMIYNFVQDKTNGSHRSFWNCRSIKPPVNGRCI